MQLAKLISAPAALPSIPRVVALLLAELDMEDPDLFQINRLLTQDPVLTMQLLRLVNSAHNQLQYRISSVAEGIALVGLNQVRDMTYAAAVNTAFRQIAGVDMHQFWRYSLNVAKLTRHLNQGKTKHISPFTAGLLHAVGELVLHLGMPKEMAALNLKVPVFSPLRATAETELLGFSYAQVGAGFAHVWKLPKDLVAVLAHQDAPFERDDYDPLSGILHLAIWRCRAMESGYGHADLEQTFPETTALALSLEMHEVLEREPIDWTTYQETADLIGK
jgi:HD-like signal output (HDOD) protein